MRSANSSFARKLKRVEFLINRNHAKKELERFDVKKSFFDSDEVFYIVKNGGGDTDNEKVERIRKLCDMRGLNLNVIRVSHIPELD